MQSITIGVHALSESHTAAYISTIILEICGQWGIEVNKVSVIVTDNAENIVKAAKDTFGRAKHLPCFAHTINLLAHDVLGTHSLKKLQYERGKTEGSALRLIQDVSTRWNSTYISLMRFCQLSDEIGITLLKHSDSPNMLTRAELNEVKVICKLLAPLYKRIASIEVYEETIIAKKIKDHLLLQFGIRFGNVERVRPLALATILDPRFKKLYFKKPLAVAEAINILCKEINIIRQNVQSTTSSTQYFDNNQHSSNNENEDLWIDHDVLITKNFVSQEEEEIEGISIELRQFLNLPVVNQTSNPYEIWDTLKSQFPNIHKIAIGHLSIVATSVPAERLFSKTGLVATDM
ncbi:uncharacterized protein LOC118645360 [Monomorium pharaonis]|uniref:uncharacterized protein LOC118645360 n=1 Tax=Monomorium pharaonis TaxID=307658 RepID=UPI001746007B|nr:uncharacterized protein LOC118645360 [Monomorium pharaonis]